jgi:MFS family permease
VTPVERRQQQRLTFAVLTVAVGAFALLQSLIVPVLAQIQQEYDTDQSTVTWVLTAYLLSASIATPMLGRIGDVVGKKRILVLALLALSVGSLAAALAPSIGWLIAARVVQGLGGGVMPLAFGIIRDNFTARMTSALSVLASLTAVGFGVGIVVAGPIVEVLGYHWLFWLPMIVTAGAAVAALAFIPESPRSPGDRLPVLPALLLAGWLVALLLPVSQGNQWGWGSTRVVVLLAVAAVTLVLWAWLETRVRVPLIDMRMMGTRGVWTTNLVTLFVGVGLFSSFAFLPQLLQTPVESGYGFGATITESGRLLLPSAVASFLVGLTTARLMGRFGARAVILTGTLVSAASYVAIALFHDTTTHVMLGITAQGLGTGMVISTSASVVIASVPASQTGVASGMNANIRTIGGSIGSAVMAGIVTAQTGPGGLPLERGYTIGFLALGACLLLAAAAGIGVPDVHRTEPRSRRAVRRSRVPAAARA